MKNRAQLTITGMILIIFVLIVIGAMMWFLLSPPSCDESDKVELVGILRGFERNSSMWDVQLNNVTYRFNHFDQNYMTRMIGFNITITACDRNVHFDYLTAYIIEGD